VIDGKDSAGYGSQRLWTALAWGVGSMGVGHCIDLYGFEAMFGLTYFLSFLVVRLIVFRPRAVRKEAEVLPLIAGGAEGLAPRKARQSITELLTAYRDMTAKKPELRKFLLLLVLYGTVNALVDNVLFLQMEREYHAQRGFMGTLTLVGTLTEVPIFYFSKTLLRRYGHATLIFVSHAAMAIRLALLGLVVTKENHTQVLMVIQSSHGLCFALFWVSVVDFASITTPVPLRATGQGVVSTSYYIVGAGLGSVGWNVVYDYLGSSVTYHLGVVVVGLSMALLQYTMGSRPHPLSGAGDHGDGDGDDVCDTLIMRRRGVSDGDSAAK